MRSAINIEYPGERTSLLLSASVVVALAIVLSSITVGVFLLLLALALFSLKLQEARARTDLIKVDEKNYPHVARMARVCAFRLDIAPPNVYLLQQLEPNAYSSGFWGKHWVVLHSCLLDMCDSDELMFVIGHEMGHIKREHTSWLILASPRAHFALPFVSDLVAMIFNNWSLRAEYSADRAGLLACRNIDSAVGALVKLQYWEKPVDVERLLRGWQKVRDYPLVKLGELFGDHPYIPNRIEKLRAFNEVLLSRAVL